MSRWLYHVVLRDEWARAGDPYAPASLAREGFVHASYRDVVAESAALYFPKDSAKVVLRIDPRALAARVVEAATPRGPMPHVHGPVPRAAVVDVIALETFDAAREPDVIAGQSDF